MAEAGGAEDAGEASSHADLLTMADGKLTDGEKVKKYVMKSVSVISGVKV